jgi:hypothetical protein
MFHRIFAKVYPLSYLIKKVKLEPMFYKLSTLHLFNQIVANKRVLKSPEQQELLKFINYMLKKMFRNLDDYPILYMQILFGKSKRDCLRIMDRDLEPESMNAGVSRDLGSDDDLDLKKGFVVISDTQITMARSTRSSSNTPSPTRQEMDDRMAHPSIPLNPNPRYSIILLLFDQHKTLPTKPTFHSRNQRINTSQP